MKKDTLIVEGLAGKKTLSGEVRISGAKNDVLKIMAASVLFAGPVKVTNVPETEDVKKMRDLLIGIGARVEQREHELTIDTTNITSTELDADLAKSMRASVVLTGPLLARFGKVTFPIPGGCVIGPRPIDLFVSAYEKMGAHVKLESDSSGDRYVITAPRGGRLAGAEIFFNIQTVGGTETLMLAAIGARGVTVLKNCALEPEIASLAEYLNSCGAKIVGAGTSTMHITGVDLSEGKGIKARAPYVTIPDRIEAGSFLILGALLAKKLTITHCNPAHLEATIELLRGSGVQIVTTANTIEVSNEGKAPTELKSFNVRTHEYPGFPTDLQAPMTVFLTQTVGESLVFETIYEGRFKFVANLEKLGASVTIMNSREILVHGLDSNKMDKAPFKAPEAGDHLDAYDIRAGFATIIAALLASGTSVINNAYFIDRGYEDIEGRLASLGANIRRVHNDTPVL